MQRLFGKILAGEIAKPSSYSIRTIKLMGQMDPDVAQTFQRFCSMCITYYTTDGVFDSRVLTLGTDRRLSLYEYGLDYVHIETLAEYGLISNVTPVKFPYGMAVPGSGVSAIVPVRYNNRSYFMNAIPPKKAVDFELHNELGIGLSRVGRELLSIVEIEENILYTRAIRSYLEKQGLRLREAVAD